MSLALQLPSSLTVGPLAPYKSCVSHSCIVRTCVDRDSTIWFFVFILFHSFKILLRKFEEELLQYQEKGTEANARTAVLYSKLGNTDFSELVVIDEMIQCTVCNDTISKGKSFCTCGAMRLEISTRKRTH